MKSIVILEITHRKPITALSNMIAGRAYSIDGVTDAQVVKLALEDERPDMAKFTLRELSLGAGEVVSL